MPNARVAMNLLYHVPAPRSEFIELARSKSGRLFRKQILRFANFAHPNVKGAKLSVTKEVGEQLVKNFQDGICDIVQVPIVDDSNAHSEDPLRNIGEVIDLEVEDDGVYATIDARDADHADKLGKTLIGASALMHMNYTDTQTGTQVGPTLLHVAVTNRPYITNLKDFEEIIAASADSIGRGALALEVASEEQTMELEELKAALLEHGIDLDDLQAKAGAKVAASGGPSTDELVTALSNVLKEAGVIQAPKGVADDDEISVKDVAEAVIELSQEKVSLEQRVTELVAREEQVALAAAETHIDTLVSEAKILPKQRDAMLKLYLSDRETFDSLLPDEALVSLSEDGVTTHDKPDSEGLQKAQAEVDRLVALANPASGKDA